MEAKMKNKTKIAISSIFLVAIVGTVYWWTSPNKEEKINETNSPKAEIMSAENKIINSLTGLPLSKNLVNNRPIAIMINNMHTGQPLFGVTDADIMFECPIEGGITRILGVYKDPAKVRAIGSVRSSRPYFINIAKGLDAIYFHLGGSTLAYEILKSGYIDSIDLIKGLYMWRDQARLKNLGLEHSALTSGEKIIESIKDKGFRTQLEKNYTYPQKFGENSQVLSGSAANKVTVIFSGYKNSTFTYDEQNQTYLISQFNKPQMDDNIKEQNSKPNVILLDISGQKIDNTELLKLDMVGSGTGKYISHGKIIDINWTRNDDSSPFKLFAKDNSPLIMLPGKSYFCLLAQWTHVNIE